VWTQSTSVTDRQTDGRTDGQTDRITITDTVQRIASHGKNYKMPLRRQLMPNTDRLRDSTQVVTELLNRVGSVYILVHEGYRNIEN